MLFCRIYRVSHLFQNAELSSPSSVKAEFVELSTLEEGTKEQQKQKSTDKADTPTAAASSEKGTTSADKASQQPQLQKVGVELTGIKLLTNPDFMLIFGIFGLAAGTHLALKWQDMSLWLLCLLSGRSLNTIFKFDYRLCFRCPLLRAFSSRPF